MRMRMRPALLKMDHWLMKWLEVTWHKNPMLAAKRIADLAPPYKGLMQGSIRLAMLDVWKMGRADAAHIVKRVKESKGFRQRKEDVVRLVRELIATEDRYMHIAKEYDAWASSIGGKAWQDKINSVRTVTTQGLREGWGLRDYHVYTDRTGKRISAFEATAGRGPKGLLPGYKRVVQTPGIQDQLGPKLRNHSAAKLESIARTEGTRAYNSGMMSIYKEDRAVCGVEVMSVIDARTTDVCLMLDGMKMTMDDPRLPDYTPPLHISCRTQLIPVFIFDENIEPTIDRKITRTLEDKGGKEYDFTYTPSRIRPMETKEGKLSPTGFGRANLQSVIDAEVRRRGFTALTSAEMRANFLHPGSAKLAAKAEATLSEAEAVAAKGES